MTPKRILLMHISEVSGHKQATLAIENAIKALEPQTEILNINAFNYTNPITEQVINRLYMSVLKRTPGIWEYLYDNPSVVKSIARFKQFVHNHNSPKLKRLYDNFKPDVIACSQAFPCGMVADFKKIYNIDVPLVAVLTDYVPHSFWLYENVDYYIAPDIETKNKLAEKGIQGEKIKVLGIPIDPKFSKAYDRKAVCVKLGLDATKPVILIMGGGHGLGPIKKIIGLTDEIRLDLQIIVVAGINEKLLRWLEKKKVKFRKKILGLGFVDNIEELMSVSTLIVTKPGGITTAEALAMGLPMVIVKPLPGQEEHNTQFLLKLGAAVLVKEEAVIGQTIAALLRQPEEIRKIKETARKIAAPNSATDIAKLLLELC